MAIYAGIRHEIVAKPSPDTEPVVQLSSDAFFQQLTKSKGFRKICFYMLNVGNLIATSIKTHLGYTRDVILLLNEQ